jgi:ribonuclease P protein component
LLPDEIVLPKAHRLRRPAEFSLVVRRGTRATSPTLVLHGWVRDDPGPVRVGFVVSRAVGNAVVRNQVKRRLRHLMAGRLAGLPAHSSLVLRANPGAGSADGDRLGRDLDSCLAGWARRPGSSVKHAS